jgi:hypothetical protein
MPGRSYDLRPLEWNCHCGSSSLKKPTGIKNEKKSWSAVVLAISQVESHYFLL